MTAAALHAHDGSTATLNADESRVENLSVCNVKHYFPEREDQDHHAETVATQGKTTTPVWDNGAMARDRTDPSAYPETMQTKCLRCGQEYTAYRKGSGQPWRGGLDYWYSDNGEHHAVCPERDAASPSDALNKWVRGG